LEKKISPAHRLWKFTVDDVGDAVPREKLEELFLRSPVDYSKVTIVVVFFFVCLKNKQWPECVSIICSSSKDIYPKVLFELLFVSCGHVVFKAIEKFRNPILWIANQKDGKSDADLFVARSAMGTLVTVPGNKYSYASPRFIPVIVAAVDSWVESNKVGVFSLLVCVRECCCV
jgi:hypothetical protein